MPAAKPTRPARGAAGTRALDHPALEDFYCEALVEPDVPLLLHPPPDGTDNDVRVPRLRRFDLELVLGFAHDEMLVAATLMLGGVLDRHPDLDICSSHGGGIVPCL